MAYTKQQWRDGAAGTTPLTAARLANIEQGISDAHDAFADGAFVPHVKASLVVNGAGQVTSDAIADNAVGTSELANGAVTKGKIASGAGTIRALLTAVPTGTDAEKAAAYDAAGIAIGDYFATGS